MFLYFVGPREQLNQDTAFLDSSQIYGQNICDGDSLREFNAGRLNMTLPEHPRYPSWRRKKGAIWGSIPLMNLRNI